VTELAFCSISALDRSLAAAAELAAGVGLAGLEVTARAPHLDPEAGAAAARSARRDVTAAGLEVTAYGSYLGHLGRWEHIRSEVEIAVVLQTRLLRVWADPVEGHGGDPTPVVAGLRAVSDMAHSEGITVVVERHAGSFADTTDRITELFARVERPELALNYQVLDSLPLEAAPAQADDAAELVGLARYFHLKNYHTGPDGRGPLLHGASLEDGVLDYRAILSAAFEAGYDGPLAIEFLSREPIPIEDKLARDVAYLRDMLHRLEAGR